MNPWLTHVAQYRDKNPNIKYKDALVLAKETYNQPVTQQPVVVASVSEKSVKKSKK
jgi:hypothetical protein